MSQVPPQGGMPGPSDGPPKPTFPAYQNAEQAVNLPEAPVRQANKVPPVGAGCKLVHPEEDLSLVSPLIRAFYLMPS